MIGVAEIYLTGDSLEQRMRSWLSSPDPLKKHSCACESRHGMFIEHAAYATAQSKDGVTSLHLASEWGQVEVARMLIDHGADVNAQNKEG